jgi:poly(hydroxyalkanoate) granule-associated protein
MADGKKGKKKQAELRESAHAIWLAGLGSLAVAEEEGTKLFRQLVDRGREFETRLGEPVAAARSSMKGLGKRAKGAIESLESTVEDQVKGALTRLGLPTRREVAELTRRVEQLRRELDGKGGATPRGKRSAKKRGRKGGA